MFRVGLGAVAAEKKAHLETLVIMFDYFINQIYEYLVLIGVARWRWCVGLVRLYALLKLSCECQVVVAILLYQPHFDSILPKYRLKMSYEYQVLIIIILFLIYVNLIEPYSIPFTHYAPALSSPTNSSCQLFLSAVLHSFISIPQLEHHSVYL